jgi:tetratricopeptide (TPR) repeat protein
MKKIPILLFLLSTNFVYGQADTTIERWATEFNEACLRDSIYPHSPTKKNIDYCSQAIERNPKNVYAYFKRALYYIELDNYEAALKDYNEAVKATPNYYYVYDARTFVKIYCLYDYKGALKDFNKAIKLVPKSKEKSSCLYTNRGHLKYSMGDKKGACEDFRIDNCRLSEEEYSKYCK